MSTNSYTRTNRTEPGTVIGVVPTTEDIVEQPVVDVDLTDPVVKLSVDEALAKVGTGKFQNILLTIAGLAFSGDAIEVSLLTFLSPCVQESWGLSNVETASIASSVFAGAMVGSVILGSTADIYGRRPAYFISCWIVLLFGICSCFSWNYETLLISRGFVGFGIGGVTSPFNLLAELLQPCERGKYLLYIEYFWTLGSIYTTLIAYFTLSLDGWRILTGLCALPVGLSLMAGFWLPESPRWLLLHNKPQEAKNVIIRIAKTNNKEDKFPPNWELIETATATDQDHTSTLVDKLKKPLEVFETRDLQIRTFLVWVVWISFGLCYYGVIMLISRIFSIGSSDGNDGNDDDDDDSKCSFNSLGVVFASAAEMVGLTLVVFTVDPLGRRASQAGLLLLAAVSSVILGVVKSVSLVTVFSSFARGSSMGASAVTWVAAPELYSTDLRATGHSLANTMARVGAFTSPYVVDSALSISEAALIFGIVNVISCMAVLLLPETAGTSLDDDNVNEADNQSRTSIGSTTSSRGTRSSISTVVVSDTYNPIANVEKGEDNEGENCDEDNREVAPSTSH